MSLMQRKAEAMIQRVEGTDFVQPERAIHFDVDRFRAEVAQRSQSVRLQTKDIEKAMLWNAILKSIEFDGRLGVTMTRHIYYLLNILFTGSDLSGQSSREQIEYVREHSFDLRIIRGGWDHIKDKDRMDEPSNYNTRWTPAGEALRQDPCFFNHDDYVRLKRFLEETYAHVDPALMRIVLRQLPKELLDSLCHFVLIRRKGELKGIGKIKEHEAIWPNIESNICDIGTMYVDPQFTAGYGFGGFIERVAKALVTREQIPGYDINLTPRSHGFVSTYLPAMARHFHFSGVVGVGMGTLQDEYDTSGPVVFLEESPDGLDAEYRSQYFGHSMLTKLLDAHGGHFEEDGVRYYQADTRPEHNDRYLGILKEGFDDRLTLTRFSYPNWKDHSRAIFAFESVS